MHDERLIKMPKMSNYLQLSDWTWLYYIKILQNSKKKWEYITEVWTQ